MLDASSTLFTIQYKQYIQIYINIFVSSSFMFITFFYNILIYNFSIKNHIPLTIKY